MARIETDPNYTNPTFSRATAPTDPFKKEDVQKVAEALSTHTHADGHGLAVPFSTAIPNGTITSAMIADGTIDTADLKDGAVTSAKILDGTIATGDLANSAVTNIKLASDTARQNLLTNGGFEIWQRGNGPFTGNVFSADRWLTSLAGTDTLSISRDTSNVDGPSNACAACTFTLGSGAGGSRIFNQCTLSELPLKGRTITFSARVRCSVANAVRVGFYEVGGAGPVNTGFHTGSGAYETLTVTLTVAAGATHIQAHVVFAASCTAYLDNAMLVVGNVAADYAPLHPADDLARCLRYYEVIGESQTTVAFSAYGTAGGVIQFAIPYKARKAVAPTATKVGTWVVTNCAQPTIGSGLDSLYIQSNVTALGMAQFYNGNSGNNITLESNP